jgi:hypothetical protein
VQEERRHERQAAIAPQVGGDQSQSHHADRPPERGREGAHDDQPRERPCGPRLRAQRRRLHLHRQPEQHPGELPLEVIGRVFEVGVVHLVFADRGTRGQAAFAHDPPQCLPHAARLQGLSRLGWKVDGGRGGHGGGEPCLVLARVEPYELAARAHVELQGRRHFRRGDRGHLDHPLRAARARAAVTRRRARREHQQASREPARRCLAQRSYVGHAAAAAGTLPQHADARGQLGKLDTTHRAGEQTHLAAAGA